MVERRGALGIPIWISLFCQAKSPVESFLSEVAPLKEE
jgi:hypothetical protein